MPTMPLIPNPLIPNPLIPNKFMVQQTETDGQLWLVSKAWGLIRLVILGLLLGSLVGCTPRLNISALKAEMRENLTDRTGLSIRTIDCPQGRLHKPNDAFNCLVRLDRESYLVVRVQQVSDRGDIRWYVVQARGVVNLATVQIEISQGLKGKTKTSGQVNCGQERYQIARTGDVIECKTVDAQGNQGIVLVTIRDEEGRYDWVLNPEENPQTAGVGKRQAKP